MKLPIFKHATFYTLKDIPPLFNEQDELNKRLDNARFKPLGERDYSARGFVNPFMDEDREELVHIQDGCLLFCYRIDERVLDNATVIIRLDKRIKELKAQGTEITPELKEDMKETICNELLPFSRVKRSQVFGYVDKKTKLFIVNASSDGVSENLTAALRSAMDGFPVSPIRFKLKPFEEMGEWLQEDKTPKDIYFSNKKLIHTQGIWESDAQAKLRDYDLKSPVTREILHGMGVAKAEIVFLLIKPECDVETLLTASVVSERDLESRRKLDLRLTGISWPFGVNKHAEDIAEINAMLFLQYQSLRYVVARLADEFGSVLGSDAELHEYAASAKDEDGLYLSVSTLRESMEVA